MTISKLDKITVKIALTVFYGLWICGFIKDSIDAWRYPDSHGAMIMSHKTLEQYLFGHMMIILYLMIGIALLYVKIKHKFWWILLHLSPIIYIIVNAFVRGWFDPEYSNF